MDRWIKCISQGGHLNATAIKGTALIQEAARRHRQSPAEIKALGEAMLAGLLLASASRPGERVSLSVRGDKFLRQAVVDATPHGTVRGFVITRDLVGELDQTRGPWQNGLLSVVRSKEGAADAVPGEPYVGTVPNVTGHLAKDLTFYLTQSEQVPSSVGLAVNVDAKGVVESAGAFLIQVMPGAGEREVRMVEQNINALQSLASQIQTSADPTVLLAKIFNDITFMILEERPLKFECNCSRERVARALRMLGKEELLDMIDSDRGAQVHCDFCAKDYNFAVEDLAGIIRNLASR